MNRLNLNKICESIRMRGECRLRRDLAAKRVLFAACGLFLLLGGTAVAGETLGDIQQEVAPISPGMELLPSSEGIVGEETKPSAKSASGEGKTDYLVSPGTFKYAGFILPAFNGDGTIFQNSLQRIDLGSGEMIYIDIGAKNNVSKGDRFLVFRPYQFIYHPVETAFGWESAGQMKKPDYDLWNDAFSIFERRKPLGYLIRTLGELEVVDVGADQSRAVIVESRESIRNGDYIARYQDQAVPAEIPDEELQDKDIEGYIVACRESSYGSGKMDILYIDKGANQNVSPGDRFEVYGTPRMEEDRLWIYGKEKMPSLTHRLGEVQVISTQQDTATAVVLRSGMELKVGQKIRSIRR